MKPVPDWFRARLHAALDRALDACGGVVNFGVGGLAPASFWIRMPTQLSDEQLSDAMDAVVKIGPEGAPTMHLTGAEGVGRAACGFDGRYMTETRVLADVTCLDCRKTVSVQHLEWLIAPAPTALCGEVNVPSVPQLTETTCPECRAKASKIAWMLAEARVPAVERTGLLPGT